MDERDEVTDLEVGSLRASQADGAEADGAENGGLMVVADERLTVTFRGLTRAEAARLMAATTEFGARRVVGGIQP